MRDEYGTGPERRIDPETMPVRMLPITAEELEHIEDRALDTEYETKLLNVGDDLRPIRNGAEVASMFADDSKPSVASRPAALAANASTQANRAVEIAVELGSESEEPYEIPMLPDDPSDADLFEFAKNHPAVRKVLKLFRGKVVSVKKK